MGDTGLSQEDIKLIKSVFTKYPEIERVVLYGSRAMGTYRNNSDIDLTLFGKKLDLTLQQAIENDLDDLLLPWRFDVSIFERLTNKDLLTHINRVGKVFYQRQ